MTPPAATPLLYPPTVLRTSRLTVRPWEPTDAPALWQLIAENQNRLRSDFPRTLAAIPDEAATHAFIAERRRNWDDRTGFQFGLWPLAEPTRCIGFVSLRDILWGPINGPRAELAYFLSGEHEGQGLMRDALRVVLHTGFALGLEKIFARVQPTNVRSRNIIQAVGFRLGGRLRRDFRNPAGQLVDVDYFDLLPGEVVPLPTA